MKNFEDILEDVVANKLNPALWENGKIKPAVSSALLKIADEFLKSIKINLTPKDIILTGSCANYNWHKGSDIDLHFVIDYKKVKNIEKDVLADYLYDASVLWNEHVKNIRINGFPVEVYAMHDAEEKIPYSAGIYSLAHKKWVKEPVLMKDPEDRSIEAKAKPWRMRIKKIIEKAKKEDRSLAIVADMKELLSDLKKFRAKGLTTKGEHSVENLVFKNLKKNNLIGELIDTSRKLYSQSLSLSEASVALAEILTWA